MIVKIMEDWIWKQEEVKRMDDCADNGRLDLEMDVQWGHKVDSVH